MKINIIFIFCISLIWGCKSIDEPKVVCDNVVLEKFNWKFCNFRGVNGWQRCGGNLDTLEIKTLKYIDNVDAEISADSPSNFCIFAHLSKSQSMFLTAVNLPECFKKDKLKIFVSGDIKIYPSIKFPNGGYSINESNCGEYFEITKISVTP